MQAHERSEIRRQRWQAAVIINGKEAAGGTVRRTVPGTFTASETFDVGMNTSSPVADDYFDKAPFAFEGRLKRLHFVNLQAERPAFTCSPDDD